jgi:hypothetical protein
MCLEVGIALDTVGKLEMEHVAVTLVDTVRRNALNQTL